MWGSVVNSQNSILLDLKKPTKWLMVILMTINISFYWIFDLGVEMMNIPFCEWKSIVVVSV